MNALWATPCGTINCTWPAALGGGAVQPPQGVVISGDLIDNGSGPATEINGCNQWKNFTAIFGMTGSDGLLKTPLYEGRGNHDADNSTVPLPAGCATVPSRAIIARNKLRLADPRLWSRRRLAGDGLALLVDVAAHDLLPHSLCPAQPLPRRDVRQPRQPRKGGHVPLHRFMGVGRGRPEFPGSRSVSACDRAGYARRRGDALRSRWMEPHLVQC